MFGILTLGSQLVELKQMVKLLEDKQIWWVSLILGSTEVTKYFPNFYNINKNGIGKWWLILLEMATKVTYWKVAPTNKIILTKILKA